jgi:hypothetical protein
LELPVFAGDAGVLVLALVLAFAALLPAFGEEPPHEASARLPRAASKAGPDASVRRRR